MALIARVSGDFHGEKWDWSDDGNDVDVDMDVEPVTSRSPSFVRLKAEGERIGHASIEDLVTESAPSSPPPSTERLPGALPIDDASLVARSAERAIELEVRAMQLEDTLAHLTDDDAREAVRTLLGDVEQVDDALRAPGLPNVLVHHAYEWVSNVVAQADAQLAPARDRGDADASIGMSVAEYSSLFVRAVLEPTIEEAIEQKERASDARAVRDLRELRERAMWLNWTLRRIAPHA